MEFYDHSDSWLYHDLMISVERLPLDVRIKARFMDDEGIDALEAGVMPTGGKTARVILSQCQWFQSKAEDKAASVLFQRAYSRLAC